HAAAAPPVAQQPSTIAGLASTTSTNTLGNPNITITFDPSRSIDGAAQDVQSAISKSGGQLPPDMPNPPPFQKVNPADQPVLFLVLHSPTFRLSDIDEVAETT